MGIDVALMFCLYCGVHKIYLHLHCVLVFGGFGASSLTQPMDVQVIINKAFALECKVNASNPPPTIIWRHEGTVVMPREELERFNESGSIDFPQNGRFVYFSKVATETLGEYTCEVTNALLTETRVSPERYNVIQPITSGEFRLYKGLPQTVERTIGENLVLYLVGAYSGINPFDAISSDCHIDRGGTGECSGTILAATNTRLTTIIPSPSCLSGDFKVLIECRMTIPGEAMPLLFFTNLTIFSKLIGLTKHRFYYNINFL